MSSTRQRHNRVRLSLDVPAELKALLDRIKARESRTYTEIVRRAVERYWRSPSNAWLDSDVFSQDKQP